MILIAMITVTAVAQISIGEDAYASPWRTFGMTRLPLTKYRSRKACVVNGNTIWLNGQKIRIADIDTTEVNEPKYSSELALGNRTTDRMFELINEGSFELKSQLRRDADGYGRKLRVLVRDGRSLGDILVWEQRL